MATIRYTIIDSPLGPLLVTSDGEAITGLRMASDDDSFDIPTGWRQTNAPFAEVREQLDAYWAGTLRTFDVPLAPGGTPFQQKVWTALGSIPYGTTCTYGAIAQRIGQPRAAQAVGAANGQNPIAIVIPCHRVVGHDGSLTGYAGGLDRKRTLLRHESQNSGLFASEAQTPMSDH
ncbi:cysteine methyltransferase [Longibacter salinarum]|uniref:Methylated-DNA--protein-cysteine methyltransferase n=1 Tax=Longibacter salinarum TaxID=1850348 RepID=A0A2A8CUC0_9BACT|nr:methylated-DNA--[protein]-cysteine S-methyltransferase [Longibacter salinarum]PEN11468.1 cysteine methyltransferase [Longibacter salinarum]